MRTLNLTTNDITSYMSNKYKNYPVGSLTKREVIFDMSTKNVKNQEKLFTKLNRVVTDSLVKAKDIKTDKDFVKNITDIIVTDINTSLKDNT